MTTILARPRWTSHHQQPVSVEVRLAHRWAKQPSTVKRMLYGSGSLNLQTADVLATFAELGQHERRAHWAGPIEAALNGMVAPPLTNALIEEKQEADVGEDLIATEFILDRTDMNRRRWLLALSRERALNLKLALALGERT